MSKWLAFTVVVAVAFLMRGLSLDRVVTPDEKRWLARSGNFYQALAYADFAQTYQFAHPGVTTMWIGTAGYLASYPGFAQEVERQQERPNKEIGVVLREAGRDPLEILAAGKMAMALVITLVLGLAFLAQVRLFGFLPALLGSLLIAADPFHIAHSRLLHLDGLVSSLMLLACLGFLNYLYRGRRGSDLALSAAAAALAWLTKTPSFFLIPFIGLLFAFELYEKQRQGAAKIDPWRAVRPLILWGGIGLAAYVVFWPAMWVAPVDTLLQALRGSAGMAIDGHEKLLYFNRQVVEDPGILFYPTAFLWRSTPVVLTGLIITCGLLIFPQARRRIGVENLRPLAALFLFAVLFTLFMSFSAKKFDRYLLPVFPMLAISAGLGFASAARLAAERLRGATGLSFAAALFLTMTIGQIGTAVSGFPYFLSTYNPLLGGTARAQDVMMVGWGEGLDQAAGYLKNLPGKTPPAVLVGVWEGTFSYFYDGPIYNSDFSPGITTAAQWESADYCIVYINQWQRKELPADLLMYLSTQAPASVVRLQGLDYVIIYKIRGQPIPDFLTNLD